jgi:hypothetical protein
VSLLSILDCTPNRVRSLVRLAACLEGTTRESLRSHMMPARIGGDSGQFSNLLRGTINLGLLRESEGQIHLSGTITAREVERDDWLVAYGDKVLVGPNLAEDRENKSFAYALAWLLGQASGTVIPWASDQQLDMQQQLEGSETYELSNKDRFAMLCYWARFLGFATQLDLAGERVVVPDPTDALLRYLPEVFATNRRLSIGTFLTRLSTVCSVLERGQVRSELEARLRTKRPETELSAATSLALWRLEKREHIRLDMSSDADAWQMTTSTAAAGVAAARRISHVEFKGI